MKLCEKVGRRLRRNSYYARGVHVSMLYQDYSHWHKGRKLKSHLYASSDIYVQAMRLMNQQPESKVVTNLAISVYGLAPYKPEQTSLFDGSRMDHDNLARHLDQINDRWGEFTVAPGAMANMGDTIIDRIAFGGVSDLESYYKTNDYDKLIEK